MAKKVKPSVSVVIPFYNLEKEASRCLESVLAQQHDDFEVICINDGSTDGTAGVLEQFARLDERVRVIHKQNGGLSDARNCGVSECRGKYVSFVDGDDVVSPCYLESMVEAMEGASDRLVIGTSVTIPEKDATKALEKLPSFATNRALSCEQACREILAKRLPTFAQAKLFHLNYYKEHPFPLGVRYEEIRTIGKLMNCTKEVRVIEPPIYGYIMREGSIVHASNASGMQGVEYAEAIQTALDDFRQLGYVFDEDLAFFKALMFVRVHDFTKRMNGDIEASIIDQIAKEAVEASYRDALRCGCASNAQKIRVLLYRFAPSVYDLAMSLFNRLYKGV